MKSELTPVQWALYRVLKEKGDVWTTQYEIARELGENYPEYYYDDKPNEFHDSQVRFRMTADIRKINDSYIIQKIIISSPKGIKLANKEEFKKYIDKEVGAAVRKLMRARRKAAKGAKDGQIKITLGQYEREVIEAFIE